VNDQQTPNQNPQKAIGGFLRGVARDRLAHRAGQLMELVFAAIVLAIVVLIGAGGSVPAWVLGVVVAVSAAALIVVRGGADADRVDARDSGGDPGADRVICFEHDVVRVDPNDTIVNRAQCASVERD
jgi:hypothetical protein